MEKVERKKPKSMRVWMEETVEGERKAVRSRDKEGHRYVIFKNKDDRKKIWNRLKKGNFYGGD